MRVGLIGYGMWGRNIARNLREMGVLTAICDKNPRPMSLACAGYPDVCTYLADDVLLDSDIDAVVVATDAESHYQIAHAALLRGLDVLVEKPMACSIEQAQRLVGTARRQDKILMVGHVFLYNLAVHKLKELMLQAGTIQYVYSQRLANFPPRKDVGVILDLAVHDVSILQFLFDDPGTDAGCPAPAKLDLTRNGLEDFASLALTFSGTPVHIDVGWMYPEKIRKMVVVSSKRTIVWDDMAREYKLEVYELDGSRSLIGLPDVEPLRRELEHFVECCQNRTQPLTDGESAIKVLEVLLS